MPAVTDLLWPSADTLQALVVIWHAAVRARDLDLAASAERELIERFRVRIALADSLATPEEARRA